MSGACMNFESSDGAGVNITQCRHCGRLNFEHSRPVPGEGAAPKLKKLIAELAEGIADSEQNDEGEDEASWNYETGILLTRAEAKIALSALRAAASPRAEPEREALRRISLIMDAWATPEGKAVALDEICNIVRAALGVSGSGHQEGR